MAHATGARLFIFDPISFDGHVVLCVFGYRAQTARISEKRALGFACQCGGSISRVCAAVTLRPDACAGRLHDRYRPNRHCGPGHYRVYPGGSRICGRFRVTDQPCQRPGCPACPAFPAWESHSNLRLGGVAARAGCHVRATAVCATGRPPTGGCAKGHPKREDHLISHLAGQPVYHQRQSGRFPA